MESKEGDIQKKFFDLIKERLPAHVSLADQLSDILEISYDSVYRRLRGEKLLTIGELQKLSRHFNISVDSLFSIDSDAIIFHTSAPSKESGLSAYLTGMYNDLALLKNARNKKIIYSAKDIPLPHYFNFKELAAFKLFFWGKTILQEPGIEKQLFSLDNTNIDEALINAGKKTLVIYNQIPSAEIWNTETFNSTIRQIAFYQEAGFFKNNDDVKVLYEQLSQLADHIKNQAEAGKKFIYGAAIPSGEPNFELYINEVILGYTTILVEADSIRKTFFLHDVLDFLITSDKKFCDKTSDIMNNIIKKSSLISSVNEKERNKFFLQLQNKIKRKKIYDEN